MKYLAAGLLAMFLGMGPVSADEHAAGAPCKCSEKCQKQCAKGDHKNCKCECGCKTGKCPHGKCHEAAPAAPHAK